MHIGSQALSAGTFNRHLVSRAHSKAKAKKNMMMALTLTSMVDMFSLLVIFLLQTFSASPEMLIVGKVDLPVAITGKEIKDAPILSLSEAGVYLDQKFVGLAADLLQDPEPLMGKLEEQRQKWQKAHPNETFPGEINLQADRSIPSSMVSQFMGMLPSQAYGSIQLAVVSGGNGG